MPEHSLLPSNEDLERQIAALADAAFAETEPVRPDVSIAGRSGNGWSHRLTLVAAVLLAALAVGGFAWFFGRPALTADPVGDSQQRQRTVADDGSGDRADDDAVPVDDAAPDAVTPSVAPSVAVADPLAIDLAELVAASDQDGLQMLDRPIATVGFTDLPDGWEVTGEDVHIAHHFSRRPSVNHVVTLDGPGPLRAVVNVDAAWEPGVVQFFPSTSGGTGKQIELGGSTATYDLNRLDWRIDDRLALTLFVSAESDIANTEDELVELARTITVVERRLERQVAEIGGGPSLIDAEPLLSGRLDDTPWVVVAAGDWLEVGSGPDLGSLGAIEIESEFRSAADQPAADGSRPTHTVSAATARLPDGMLWFGTVSEPDVTLVVVFEHGEAMVPTVPHGAGSAFALPLDRRLDLVEVIFSGGDGERLLVESLDDRVGPVAFTDS